MQYDIAVLGSGPGGYVAAIRASQLGFKTVVIEKESIGGVCLNWGCIPTKALLKSAQVFEYAKHAADYGINTQGASVDFNSVVKRSRGVADKMSRGVMFLMKKNKIDVINGFGKLVSKGQLEVTPKEGEARIIEARHIVIATGSRSKEIPKIKIDGKNIIGYKEALNLPAIPKSMIIMGSGAIGVEFAYFYNTMGTKVTIVELLPKIVPAEDEEISKEIEKIYKKKGIEILTSSSVENVSVSKNGVVAEIKTASSSIKLEADVLLSAVGISSNIDNIGLEDLSVEVKAGKISVDQYYRTNVDRIYAIGDVVLGQALAHVASKEAVICVEAIAFSEKKIAHIPEVLDYNNVPSCIYCSPEIASVGLTEKKARELGYEVKIGKFPFSASGKASAAGHNEGFVKVIFDSKYGELLGTHMIGGSVTEIIAESVLARKLESTYKEFLDSIHPHPTMSEALVESIAQAYGEVIHL